MRACIALIADEVYPSRKAGYVLRRILRRACRYAIKRTTLPLMTKLVPHAIEQMQAANPSLNQKSKAIQAVIEKEEQQFARTLQSGIQYLQSKLADHKELSGEDAFMLYDTYGFPIDLTLDICREQNVKVDEEGFHVAMNAQKERSRAHQKFSTNLTLLSHILKLSLC